MLPVLGACVEPELVLVVDGADQFPKRDFTAAGCVVVVVAPVETVPVGVLDKPGKTDGAAVVLLADPNIEGVLLEETVAAGLVVVRDDGCPNPVLAAAPKMGLKFWTGALLSWVDVAEEEAGTAKMGLNPEAKRGLVLLTDSELLAGAVTEVVTGLEDEEAAAVLIWLASPNRPAPVTGGVLLEAVET